MSRKNRNKPHNISNVATEQKNLSNPVVEAAEAVRQTFNQHGPTPSDPIYNPNLVAAPAPVAAPDPAPVTVPEPLLDATPLAPATQVPADFVVPVVPVAPVPAAPATQVPAAPMAPVPAASGYWCTIM
jgi:hypothetical protein